MLWMPWLLVLLAGTTFAAPVKVFTYFYVVKTKDQDGNPVDHDREALALWKRQWQAIQTGKDDQPIQPHTQTVTAWACHPSAKFLGSIKVLTEAHARKHPQYSEFLPRYHDLPTVNSKQYEVSCFVRYLALAAVGGGLMVDYDVFPLHNAQPHLRLPENFTVWDRGAVPCMVSGSGEQFTAVADFMAYFNFSAAPSYHNGRPHTSDMHIMQHMAKKKLVDMVPCIIPTVQKVSCGANVTNYGLPRACSNVPVALHFSHGAVAQHLGHHVPGPFNAARNRLISQYFHDRRQQCESPDDDGHRSG